MVIKNETIERKHTTNQQQQSANTHHNKCWLFVCLLVLADCMDVFLGDNDDYDDDDDDGQKKNERYSTTTITAKQNKKHKVCMVCDMLPPQTSHIYTHNICSFIKFYSHNDDNINNISNRIY